ncbi:DUF6660 family protein [Arachidicoccus terrestris]|uniref:DUF6660 family protein n=1 Tax=Arachidicoccus terrestris TaxID=2875539 RepID=UPI0037426759
MKFMAFILCITVMALSIMPCQDINASTAQQALTVSQSSGTHQCGHDDHCSPFCLCSCCPSAATSEAPGTVFRLNAPAAITVKKEYLIREVTFASNFFDNIWQPPKDQIAA